MGGEHLESSFIVTGIPPISSNETDSSPQLPLSRKTSPSAPSSRPGRCSCQVGARVPRIPRVCWWSSSPCAPARPSPTLRQAPGALRAPPPLEAMRRLVLAGEGHRAWLGTARSLPGEASCATGVRCELSLSAGTTGPPAQRVHERAGRRSHRRKHGPRSIRGQHLIGVCPALGLKPPTS